MISYARKYDVSENLNHYRLDGIRYKIREYMSTRKGHIGLDARKFSCAKISTFTVFRPGNESPPCVDMAGTSDPFSRCVIVRD